MDGFVKISRYAGMRPDLAQAGGGNSSVKINDKLMLVKSSGYRLSDVNETEGYTKVNLELLKNEIYSNLKNKEYDFNSLLNKSTIEGKKPSIETYIHAITKKYTLHTHPTAVNAIMSQKNYTEILSKIFSTDRYPIIDYAKPGIELAIKILELGDALDSSVQIVFMQNHGLIISADDYNDVVTNYESVLKRVEEYIRFDGKKYHNITKIAEKCPDKFVYLYNKKIASNDSFYYEYCPDNIVYLGEKILNIKSLEELDNIKNDVKTIYYENYLYILANSYKKAKEAEEIISNTLEINSYCDKNNVILFNSDEIKDIISRPDEKYRQNL